MPRSPSAAADTDPPTPPADGDPVSAPIPATAPLRFTAPDHVSAITLSTGREIRVEGGTLTAPDDLSDNERQQILGAGFAPA